MTLPNKLTPPSDSLLEKLTQADICCCDCGQKYGTYSVGCSSTWTAKCPICEEVKGCTEVRDWGYLTKGINELKAWRPAKPFSDLTEDFPPERKERIKQQSKILAEHLATIDPIMNDDELEDCLTASYEQGEITLKLTEDEVDFLRECLDLIVENHDCLCPGHSAGNPETVRLFEGIEKKITDLYDDYCVKYTLAPAMKSYIAIHGAIPDDDEKWVIFRDAFEAGLTWPRKQGQGAEQ